MHPPTITSATSDDGEYEKKDLAADGPTIERAKKLEESAIIRNAADYGLEDSLAGQDAVTIDENTPSELLTEEEQKIVDKWNVKSDEGTGEQQPQEFVELKPEGIKRKIFEEGGDGISAISTNKTESGIIEENLVSNRTEVASGDTIKKTLQRTYGEKAEDIYQTLQGMNQDELADMGFVDGDLNKIRAGEYLDLSTAFKKMNEASQREDNQTMIAGTEGIPEKTPTSMADAQIPDALREEVFAKVTDKDASTKELVSHLKDDSGNVNEEVVDYMKNLQQKFEDAVGETGDAVVDGIVYTQEALKTGIDNLDSLLAFTKKEAPTYDPSKKNEYQTLGSHQPQKESTIYGSESEDYL